MSASAKADPKIQVDSPVRGFEMKFAHNPDLDEVFDLQAEQVSADIARAKNARQFVIYLSCPISSRGGGFSLTNVDIAHFIESQLRLRFGDRFWILNPVLYQKQSRSGRELVGHQMRRLGKKEEETAEPGGGDYMRMWTKALVGAAHVPAGAAKGAGEKPEAPRPGTIDAFYFVGPRDVHDFFLSGGEGNLSACIEGYLARKCSASHSFRTYFEKEPVKGKDLETTGQARDEKSWREVRERFVEFYALKAGAAFSKGSHDEWNIFVMLNRMRMQLTGEVGEQIPAYFDGVQVDPASAQTPIVPGYEAQK